MGSEPDRNGSQSGGGFAGVTCGLVVAWLRGRAFLYDALGCGLDEKAECALLQQKFWKRWQAERIT